MSICTHLLQSFKYTIIRYKQRHHNDISLYTQWFQSTGINPLVDPVSTHTVQGPVLVPRRDLELVRGQQSLRAAWLGRYPFCLCTPACWFLSHSRLHSSMVMTGALVSLHSYG